jgi:Ca2+-binding EF-hand superfamily protein
VPEFGFRSEEDIQEIFLYLSEGNGYFRFRDWLLEQNIHLKFLLDGSIRAPSSVSGGGGDPISGRNNITTSFLVNPDPSLNDSRISASMTHNTSQQFIPPPQINNEDGRLRNHNKTLTHNLGIIKNKLKNYIQD